MEEIEVLEKDEEEVNIIKEGKAKDNIPRVADQKNFRMKFDIIYISSLFFLQIFLLFHLVFFSPISVLSFYEVFVHLHMTWVL